MALQIASPNISPKVTRDPLLSYLLQVMSIDTKDKNEKCYSRKYSKYIGEYIVLCINRCVDQAHLPSSAIKPQPSNMLPKAYVNLPLDAFIISLLNKKSWASSWCYHQSSTHPIQSDIGSPRPNRYISRFLHSTRPSHH